MIPPPMTGRPKNEGILQAIHRFHDGPARDLYKLYALADNAMLDTIVKGALARGLLENIARADARNPSQMEMTPYLG
jgi:hypothetical protein